MDSLIKIPEGHPSLLDVDEPPVYRLGNTRSKHPMLILCDHASNATPRCLGKMGLTTEHFEQHIAYDIGGKDVSLRLSELLDCPLITANYSRLVIDLNRHPGDGSSIPEISDGIEIPANRHLSPDDIAGRENTFFWPYHNAVTKQLLEMKAKAMTPLIISIHSFTPEYRGYQRPWHIGVLWDQDQRMARPLIESLSTEAGICVGDNEPYHARNPLGFTMDVHCERNGFPHVLLEIRQDLINDKKKADDWAALIHRHLINALDQTRLLAQL